MNYEAFYFADGNERARFLKDPVRWCGWITDPVTHRRFHPLKEAPREEHGGRIFYFASDSTRALFAAQPDSFAAPRSEMIAMATEAMSSR